MGAAGAKGEGNYFGAFREVPITDIKPEGWLLQFLQREAEGLGTHYPVSGHPFESGLWAGSTPGAFNWGNDAEMAYLIDGDYRLGLLLGDKTRRDRGDEHRLRAEEHPAERAKLGPRRRINSGRTGRRTSGAFRLFFSAGR